MHQQVICFAEDVEDEDSESESGDSNSNEYYDKEDENEEVYYNYTYVEAYNDEVELDDVEVFYKAETDDDSEYVITAETANIYVSSISEVLVCLFVTFFWILWLVGAIFPNRMQDLYRSDGIVVQGRVVNSYDDGDSGEAFFSTCYAVVTYVVPAKPIRNRTSDRQQSIIDNKQIGPGEYELTDMESKHNFKVPTLPRSVKKGVDTSIQKQWGLNSESGLEGMHVESNGDDVSLENHNAMNTNKKNESEQKSLFDCCSFNHDATPRISNNRPYLQSSNFITHNYKEENVKEGLNPVKSDEDIDPERIGGFIEVSGLDRMFPQLKAWTTRSRNRIPSEKQSVPVRVKKKFETRTLLIPGQSNVEVLVLPGNPTSGILKTEFEEIELENFGHSNSPFDEENRPKMHRQGMMAKDDLTMAGVGVVLATVSTISAVNAALKLPYSTRAFGLGILVTSLTFMWPLAMFAYKTGFRLRMVMMNKILSFERCTPTDGSKIKVDCGSSDLSQLHRLASSVAKDNDYFIMLDQYKNGQRKGVYINEENSAISSLSGGGRYLR